MNYIMDVVLFLRYSSNAQNEQSIEGQQRECEKFCKQNKYRIVGTYIDRATSASKDLEKRVNFLRMIKDSEKRQFQGVVVYSLDRFSRDRYVTATYKHKLKQNGVKLISATEHLSDSPESIILESVLEGMAEFYSKELSQKVTRGMHETALKGNSCGGTINLGYKIENKKYVIDPVYAPIVKEAFDRYAKGETVAQIYRSFEERGIRTKKGGKFNKNSFRQMFGNRRYIGEYKYKDIVIPGGMPALIDEETFEAVQKRLKRNAKAPARGRATTDYLLSMKLFCGHCGGLMIGISSTSHTGAKHYYYSCSTRKYENACTKKHVRKDDIERAVAEDALASITPELIEEIADMAMKAQEEDIKKDSVIPALKAELTETEHSLTNLIRLIENGANSPTLVNRINELEAKKATISKQLRQEETSRFQIQREHIIFWLSKFTDGDIDDPAFRKEILDYLIEKVWVWDLPDGGYRLKIALNLIGKPVKHELTLNDLPPDFSDNAPNPSIFTNEKGKNEHSFISISGAPNENKTNLDENSKFVLFFSRDYFVLKIKL